MRKPKGTWAAIVLCAAAGQLAFEDRSEADLDAADGEIDTDPPAHGDGSADAVAPVTCADAAAYELGCGVDLTCATACWTNLRDAHETLASATMTCAKAHCSAECTAPASSACRSCVDAACAAEIAGCTSATEYP